MNLDHHESSIRNKLLQHREVIDPDEVWQDLEPQLHPKKKRRAIFFWLFGGLGLAFIAALWLYPTSEQQKERSTADGKPFATVGHTADDHASTAKSANQLVSKTDLQNKSTEPIDNPTPTTHQLPHSSNIEDNPSDRISSKLNHETINKSNNHTSTGFVTDQQQKNNSVTTQVYPNKNPKPILNRTINELSKAHKISSKSTSNISEKPRRLLNDNKPKLTPNQILDSRFTDNETSATRVSKASNNLNKLPILFLSLLREDEIESIGINKNNLTNTLKPITKSQKKISLTASVGWGNFNSKYSAFDINDEAYVDHMNEINSGVSSQHATLGLRYAINNWYLSSGIEFNHFVNRTKLYQVSTVDTMVNGVQERYYKRSGDIEETEGQVSAVIQRTTDIQWHTYRQLIDLPLSIGYKKDFHRFSIGAHAGISVNVSQRAKGAYINQVGRLIKFNSTSSDNPYQTKYGLSYTGGLHVIYHVLPSLSVELSGNYRAFPSRTIQFEQQLKENIKSGQLRMGVIYRL